MPRISQLETTTPAEDDSLPIFDASEEATKRITVASILDLTAAQTVQVLPLVTGYTGGGTTKLDGVVTVGVSVLRVIGFVHASDGFVHYQLKAGTPAEAAPGIVLPDDHNALTNAKYWQAI